MMKKLLTLASFALLALAPVLAQEDNSRAAYYGTWKFAEDNNSEEITFTSDSLVFALKIDIGLGVIGPLCYTLGNLVWEEVRNDTGEYASGYPVGYKIAGTVTSVPPVGSITITRPDGSKAKAEVGETAAEWFYLRHSDKGALMKGDPDSERHGPEYGPYSKEL